MIVAAAAMLGISANAASYVWKTNGGYVLEPGTLAAPVAVSSATAYLFATGGQGNLVDAFFEGKGTIDLSATGFGSLDNSPISNGAIATKTSAKVEYDGALTGYFATLVNIDGQNMLFISDTFDGTAKSTGYDTLKFNPTAASGAAAMDASKGWQGTGWYSVVPEPTSGLLLLLGVAGLALRRRRA